MWLICGKLLESLGACLDDPSSATLTTAEASFADFADMGVVYRPTYHALLAEVCLRGRDLDRGLGHIATARLVITASGERWNEAQLIRLEVERTRDADHARQCFARAHDLAIRQGAVMWAHSAHRSATGLTAPV